MSGRHLLPGTTLRQRTADAVANERLRTNVARAVDRFSSHRREGLAELDDADGLRRAARAVKQQVLADLPGLLEQFADQVTARGGNVCWAPTADDARSGLPVGDRRGGRQHHLGPGQPAGQRNQHGGGRAPLDGRERQPGLRRPRGDHVRIRI